MAHKGRRRDGQCVQKDSYLGLRLKSGTVCSVGDEEGTEDDLASKVPPRLKTQLVTMAKMKGIEIIKKVIKCKALN